MDISSDGHTFRVTYEPGDVQPPILMPDLVLLGLSELHGVEVDGRPASGRRPMPEHLCHHPSCDTPVPPKMFSCRPHWYQLPKPLRDAIWAAYVPGQERRKDPTRKYLEAARAAIAWWEDMAAAEVGKAHAGGTPDA